MLLPNLIQKKKIRNRLQLNGQIACRKRKTGVGYNDGKDQFKRQKGAQGKGLSCVAPDKGGELGLSNHDTESRELVDREAN
jgi:hypothetical protein